MWHRLAKHVDVVLLDVVVNLVAYELVDSVHLYLWSYLLLYEWQRSLSGAEARHVYATAIFVELLAYVILIVCFFNDDGHQATAGLCAVVECNVHKLFLSYCYYHRFVRVFL